MIIAKKPEEEIFETEGYGFFLGDIGKFIFKAVPAAIGGFLVGNVPGAIAGAATGFIGGKPSKVLKRFLYGVGAGGLVSGVTGLVAPEYQAYVQGPLSSKISEALSKIKTSIPGMTGGEVQVAAPGIKEGMTMAEKLKYWYKMPELTMAEKMKSVVLPSISSQIGAGVGTAGIGTKLISASKELIKTGLETLAKGLVVSQIPSIIGAQMQYPTVPFQIYQLPEEEGGGGAVIYEPTTDTLIVPQPIAEKAVKDVKKEIEEKKKIPTKLPVAPPTKPPTVPPTKPPVKTGIIEEKYLPYIILLGSIGIGALILLKPEKRR